MSAAAFGKYRLIAELGHGGMADVFLAVIAGPAGSGFSKLTVVKRLRQNLAEEPEFVEMLVDEARISARLNHPNVVQTNEVGSVGNHYFLAMEYLDGQPLHRIQHRAQQKVKADPSLADQALPKECQYLVLADALAGLHHAHELADYDGTPLEIVHRDVTPHNIFVTYEGQTKVVDFGIAKAVGRSSETRQGVVKGKIRYMAPEQAIGQKVDRRADLFSVGIMLWEVAVGRRLWQGYDDMNIVQLLVGGDLKPSPKEANAEVPDEVDRICRKALATNPDDRYQTAEEMRMEIEQFLAEQGLLVQARRKLGSSVNELFKDKRDEIRAIIEKQLAALRLETESSGAFEPVQIENNSLGSFPSGSGPISGTAVMPTTVSTNNVRAAAPRAEDGSTSITNAATELYYDGKGKPKSGRGRMVATFVAGAAVLAAIGAVAVMKVRRPGGDAPGSQVAVDDKANTKETTNAVVNAAPTEVHVKLSAVPTNARMTLDGALLASPYDARLARDGKPHTLRVEAPGYEPMVETVKFEADVDRTFTMTKAAPSGKPVAQAPHGTWGRPAPKSAPTQENTAPPPPPPPPPPTTPTAAAHPTTKSTSKPMIDTSEDPWNKKP